MYWRWYTNSKLFNTNTNCKKLLALVLWYGMEHGTAKNYGIFYYGIFITEYSEYYGILRKSGVWHKETFWWHIKPEFIIKANIILLLDLRYIYLYTNNEVAGTSFTIVGSRCSSSRQRATQGRRRGKNVISLRYHFLSCNLFTLTHLPWCLGILGNLSFANEMGKGWDTIFILSHFVYMGPTRT